MFDVASLNPVSLSAMAVEMPAVDQHPNRIPFSGCLTLIDEPSDRAPNGARGHRVILTRAAALAALPSLIGMGIGFKDGWDGHDARQKCGVITAARVEDTRLLVDGFVYARDFPDVQKQSKKQPMGMSYELADAHVDDMRALVWTLTKVTFTGAAVLLRSKAAYRTTCFEMAA